MNTTLDVSTLLPDEDTLRARREALVSQIESESTRRMPTGARGVLVAVGIGVTALAIGLPSILFGGHGEVGTAAARVLQDAAATAASQEPVAAPGPGQYYFTRTKSAYLDTTVVGRDDSYSVLEPEIDEDWYGPDGSGRQRSVHGQPTFPSPEQKQAWEKAGSPPLQVAGSIGDSRYKPGELRYLDYSGLPTDPEQLKAVIEERKSPWFDGPKGDAETFVLIGDMLRKNYLSPELRAALFQVTAELPGVQLLGKVSDPIGREGIGIAYTKGKIRNELIFDSKTSALLGEREVQVDPSNYLGASAGTVTGYAAYLDSRVVDSLDDPGTTAAAR